MEHATQEMGYLAEFLPALYKAETNTIQQETE